MSKSKLFHDGKEYTPFRMNIESSLLEFLNQDRLDGVSITKHINYILNKHRAVKESRNGKYK